MKVEKITYKDYGALRLSAADVELVVLTEVGPRIVSLKKANGQNLLANFDEQFADRDPSKLHFLGGHRLWHSPEDPVRTYCPDNTPCQVVENNNTVILIANPEPTGLQKSMGISIQDDGTIVVVHTITNRGYFDVTFADWGITQMAPGGFCAVPQTKKDTGLLPNRVVSVWPYARLNDPRFYFGKDFICVSSEKVDGGRPLKIGTSNEMKFAAYFLNDQLFVKNFDYVDGETYPDNGCNFELYTNGKFLEVESLSPLKTVGHDNFVTHTEIWRVFDGVKTPEKSDEAAILNALADKVDLTAITECKL